MLISPPQGAPYHRLARTTAHRWWRPVAGTAFIVAAGFAVMMACFVAFTAVAWIDGRPSDADGVPSLGPLGELAEAFLTIGAVLPVVLLAARWIQRRPAGTLSSVAGRVRWRWLLTCLPVAFVAIVVFLALTTALAEATGEDAGVGDALAGWGPFAVSTLVLILVVPPQAAAEEYVTRGWLMQGLGVWFRAAWVPIALQAAVFAALHGWGTPWGFADLVVFGVIAGWLTVRTGGLEAAIALHVMNNLLSSVVMAAYGDLSLDETAADMPWQAVAVDVPVLCTYAAVVWWIARRKGIAARTTGGPLAAPATNPVLARVAAR